MSVATDLARLRVLFSTTISRALPRTTIDNKHAEPTAPAPITPTFINPPLFIESNTCWLGAWPHSLLSRCSRQIAGWRFLLLYRDDKRFCLAQQKRIATMSAREVVVAVGLCAGSGGGACGGKARCDGAARIAAGAAANSSPPSSRPGCFGDEAGISPASSSYGSA